MLSSIQLETLPLRALELLSRPFPQFMSEHARVQAQDCLSRWLLRVSRLKQKPMRHPTPAHASGHTHPYRVRTAGDAAELDVASKTGSGCEWALM